jgi:hypothetical protein
MVVLGVQEEIAGAAFMPQIEQFALEIPRFGVPREADIV